MKKTKRKILCVFGTRPEAIKMAPVIEALRARPREFEARVVVTAQHRGLLDQALSLFKIRSHYDLNIMRPRQTLTDVSVRALERLGPVYKKECPDMVLVQGDTSTAFLAGLAAFYQKIPVGHVEAGLRSHDVFNPYPEEMNRHLLSVLADLHFSPTTSARQNLLKENVPAKKIFVTGNTVIDALASAVRKMRLGQVSPPRPKIQKILQKPFILITAHRRENFGEPMKNIFRGLREAARKWKEVQFVYPVHPNPNVRLLARSFLAKEPNFHLFPPLGYGDFLWFLSQARFLVTDSGGLQEEGPFLSKPVLVLRDTTERPEAVEAGAAKVIGTDPQQIRRWVDRLMKDSTLFNRMAVATNPYGDGCAATRIVEILRCFFGFRRGFPASFTRNRHPKM